MTTSLLVTEFLYKVQIALSALISAMLLAPSTSSQMPVENDTFEKTARTEYVTNPAETLANDVYNLAANPVGNKERGEKFNKWFWDMVGCADDDGSFNAKKLNGAPIGFDLPNKDYKQLAADIICTFDKNGDNRVDWREYHEKSDALVNQKAGRTLSLSEKDAFNKDFFIPWFDGFGFDREPNDYSIDEVAASLYALDNLSCGGNGYIRGDILIEELGYVMDHGEPDANFELTRAKYYSENNIKL